jgi:hypothetical protein
MEAPGIFSIQITNFYKILTIKMETPGTFGYTLNFPIN